MGKKEENKNNVGGFNGSISLTNDNARSFFRLINDFKPFADIIPRFFGDSRFRDFSSVNGGLLKSNYYVEYINAYYSDMENDFMRFIVITIVKKTVDFLMMLTKIRFGASAARNLALTLNRNLIWIHLNTLIPDDSVAITVKPSTEFPFVESIFKLYSDDPFCQNIIIDDIETMSIDSNSEQPDETA